MDLKEEGLLGNQISQHWYYKSKASALLRLVGNYENKIVLDVGAGSGFFTKYLLNNTLAEKGICVDISYPTEWKEQVNGKEINYLKNCGPVDADLVLLMDVLEHVDDDIELLRQYISKVQTGARFLITVPAFNFLWSGHDVFLEHRRRYTLKDINRLINAAGLEKNVLCYYFGSVFPIAVAIRLAKRLIKGRGQAENELKIHGSLTNSLLATFCYAELPFFKLNKFAGLSVFCLCRK